MNIWTGGIWRYRGDLIFQGGAKTQDDTMAVQYFLSIIHGPFFNNAQPRLSNCKIYLSAPNNTLTEDNIQITQDIGQHTDNICLCFMHFKIIKSDCQLEYCFRKYSNILKCFSQCVTPNELLLKNITPTYISHQHPPEIKNFRTPTSTYMLIEILKKSLIYHDLRTF